MTDLIKIYDKAAALAAKQPEANQTQIIKNVLKDHINGNRETLLSYRLICIHFIDNGSLVHFSSLLLLFVFFMCAIPFLDYSHMLGNIVISLFVLIPIIILYFIYYSYRQKYISILFLLNDIEQEYNILFQAREIAKLINERY